VPLSDTTFPVSTPAPGITTPSNPTGSASVDSPSLLDQRYLPPLVDVVQWAKRRAMTTRERQASGGAYVSEDVVWLLPTAQVPQGFDAKPGDVVVALQDAGKNRWTVLERGLNRLRNTWRLSCRNLSVVQGLDDEIQIERAQLSYDASGAPVKTFPVPIPPTAPGQPTTFSGGIVLYPRLPARMQPRETQIAEERGIRGPKTIFDCIVSQQVSISTEDRIYYHGQYYEITGYRQAERIDELPVIECALSP
jgi:hypothetical protein